MRKLGRVARRYLKRHAEALFIIAFILADCFLSGWALTVGTVGAILYVVLPALRTLVGLSPVARITFVKAFVKTPKVQKLALLLFWLYSMRWLLYAATTAKLFAVPAGQTASISNALILGSQQFAPLAFLASPFIFYAIACFVAIVLRSRLKASAQDPDLIAQRQTWSRGAYALFALSFVGSIANIVMNKKGPAFMLSNWLLASAKDANLFTGEKTDVFADMSFIQSFDTFILTAVSLAIFLALLQPVLKLNSFLVSFCWRVVSPKSLQNVIEGFLEALRLPSRQLNFQKSHPFWSNAFRTLLWLVACYAALFWLFGFCGGPLGYAIQSWMIASTVDAGFAPASGAPDWIFQPNLRVFLGSIVALYGTAPMAVSAAVLLPFAKPRKIILNNDGLLFAQGPFLSLYARQFRLWSDLKSISVRKVEQPDSAKKAEFTLEFRSGGRITFNNLQVPAQDLRVLLDGADQHAVACTIDSGVFAICQELIDADRDRASSDGIEDSAIASIPVQEFKSTIFVPLGVGEFIPNSRTRIIKQLASKPLCAVYLARDESGRMVIVKQFYLADETEETKALSKILRREYDLLSRLDSPGIARVLSCETVEQSTYLVIEHRVGADLRAVVKEHGARSESLTIAWAKQLCEVMIYLHGREPVIIHRDLTPDNVIAGEDGQLRLIDFGAAREFLDGITGTMIGKHCYVAPEQLRGEANQRSDVYSFGCTLYFLLTGRDPVALSQSAPAKIIDCSQELDQLIRDCTEFDEAKRPQTFDEILNRLNEMDRGVRLKFAAAQEKVSA